PQPSPPGSPLPSEGRGVRGEGNGRVGRGRIVRRFALGSDRFERSQCGDGQRSIGSAECVGNYSFSRRERVGPSPRKSGFGPAGRVRGNQAFLFVSRKMTPGSVELRPSSGRAGDFLAIP